MFSKLLKHEMKVQAGLIGVLSLAVLGIGALCGTMRWLCAILEESNADDAVISIGILFSGMITAGAIIAVIAYAIGIYIILAYRFYKHHFSDEGYLTFTLPVSTHQLLLSSILNIVIWVIIAGFVTYASILLIEMPDIIRSSQKIPNYFYSLDIYEYLLDEDNVYLHILSVIASFAYSLILPLLSITIGAQVAKKHKLLAAFGIGYGLSVAISFISGILSIVSLIGDAAVSSGSYQEFFILSMLIPALLQFGISIGGYFIMHHLMAKKLNLP